MIVEAGREPDLVGALRQQYSDQAHGQGRKFPIRVSALGDCPRKLASLLRRVESDVPTDRSMRIFEIGNSRGEYLARSALAQIEAPAYGVLEGEVYVPTMVVGEMAKRVLAKANGEWEDHGLSLSPSGVLMVRGRYDLGIFHGERMTVDVVDFKTASDYGFKVNATSEVDDRYRVQICAYGIGLEQLGYKVNSCQLVFENKNTCELMARPVPLDEGNRALVYSKLAMVSDIMIEWAKGTSFDEHAPAEYAHGVMSGSLPWQCNYCSIGPLRGRCTGGRAVVDSPRSNTTGPHRWVVS